MSSSYWITAICDSEDEGAVRQVLGRDPEFPFPTHAIGFIEPKKESPWTVVTTHWSGKVGDPRRLLDALASCELRWLEQLVILLRGLNDNAFGIFARVGEQMHELMRPGSFRAAEDIYPVLRLAHE